MTAVLPAFDLRGFIQQHKDALKPPVCNKQVFPQDDFIVMVVGGPNGRRDFHFEEGPEFFYQLEGDMVLYTLQEGKRVAYPIKAGEVFFLPPRVPHSPVRFADSVGLVVERKRLPHEKDALMWFCETCDELLYEEYFKLRSIEEDFLPVFARYYASEAWRTCKRCKTVMPADGKLSL